METKKQWVTPEIKEIVVEASTHYPDSDYTLEGASEPV